MTCCSYVVEHDGKSYLPDGVFTPPDTNACSMCDKVIELAKPSGGGISFPRYSIFVNESGEQVKVCEDCVAVYDKAAMDATGLATLYLDAFQVEYTVMRPNSVVPGLHPHTIKLTKYRMTNASGKLAFDVRSYRKGRHSVAHSRIDVWFRDDSGAIWWGVNYGDWSQLTHCKRLKRNYI